MYRKKPIREDTDYVLKVIFTLVSKLDKIDSTERRFSMLYVCKTETAQILV